MNDHAIYELAKARQADLLAEATGVRPARRPRRHRRARHDAAVRGVRRTCALALRRLANRIEPAHPPQRITPLPAQRRRRDRTAAVSRA
ncbi:MAG: hypothetical protein ACRDP8_03855 [Actinopolymorphaceae bacterium]